MKMRFAAGGNNQNDDLFYQMRIAVRDMVLTDNPKGYPTNTGKLFHVY